jgi:undecaprenyl-diphosphatase
VSLTASRTEATSEVNGLGLRIAGYSLFTLIVGAIAYTFDERLTLALKYSHTDLLALGAISDIGRGEIYIVPSFLIILTGYLLRNMTFVEQVARWLKLIVAQAAFLFGSVVLSGLLIDIVKPLIGRTRPKLVEWYGAYNYVPLTIESTYLSMPSGHAATMGAVTCAMCIWLPSWRSVLLPVGFFFATTRMFALAHYLSDVIIGFGFGYVFTLFFTMYLERRDAGFRLEKGFMKPTSDLLQRSRILR